MKFCEVKSEIKQKMKAVVEHTGACYETHCPYYSKTFENCIEIATEKMKAESLYRGVNA